jgi:hypothetical protein
MAIEEKQRALEFTYTSEIGGMIVKYDIIYSIDRPDFPLQVSGGDSKNDYPLNLFVEVVDFLVSKGIIKPRILHRATGPSVPFAPLSKDIPLPQIQMKEKQIDFPQVSQNIDPLASFDITIPLSTEISSASSDDNIMLEKGQNVTVKIADKNTITDKEIISRPVIRSRVRGKDPLSAEKEAAQIRAAQMSDDKKAIKRIER